MFLILGHEECVIVVWRGYPTKCLPGYYIIFICQWQRNVVDSWWLVICIAISVICFSVDLHWKYWNWNTLFDGCIFFQKRLHILDLKRKRGTQGLSCFSFILCIFSSSCIVSLFVRKNIVSLWEMAYLHCDIVDPKNCTVEVDCIV